MSDPVACRSTFLCMYMRNHPDTLVAYVKHFGKVAGNVSSAEMKSIDSKGIDLSYSLKSGGVGSVHVKFDPSLTSYEEVKPRMLAMKADAQEALGMVQSPRITSFRLPCGVKYILYFYVGALYVTLAPPGGTSLPPIPTSITDAVFMPVHTLSNMIGFRPTLLGVAKFSAIVHGIESLCTMYLCSRYVEGPFVTAAYMFATWAFGMPILVGLRQRILAMRIESVMKAE